MKKMLNQLQKDKVFNEYKSFYHIQSHLSKNSRKYDKEEQSLITAIEKCLCIKINQNSRKPYSDCNINNDTLKLLYKNIESIDNPIIISRILDIIFCFQIIKPPIEVARKCIEQYKYCIDLYLDKKAFNVNNSNCRDFIFSRWKYLSNAINNDDTKKDFLSNLDSYSELELTKHNALFLIKNIYPCYISQEESDQQVLIVSKLNNFITNEIYNSFNYEIRYSILNTLIKLVYYHDKAKVISLQELQGQIFLDEANDQDKAFFKTIFIKKAILHYSNSNIENKNSILNELNLKVKNLQSQIQFEMSPGSISNQDTDNQLTKYFEQQSRHIQGKSFEDALIHMALNIKMGLLSKSFFDKNVKEFIKKSFLSLIRGHRTDALGRTISEAENNYEQEKALQLQLMFNLVAVNISYSLNIINLEHHYTEYDLLKITEHTYFIPKNLQFIMAKGLYYFLRGDYIESAYLITLNIESCLRNILKLNNISTNILIKKETDKEKISIKSLLKLCVDNNILDEISAFYLDYILIGHDCQLRDHIARGLVESYSLYNNPRVMVLNCILLYLLYYDEIMILLNDISNETSNKIS